MQRLITTSLVMGYNPCPDFPEARVSGLLGEGKTPLEILDLKGVTIQERLWCLLRTDIIDRQPLAELACDFAAIGMPAFKYKFRDDKRVAAALDYARVAAKGLATDTGISAQLQILNSILVDISTKMYAGGDWAAAQAVLAVYYALHGHAFDVVHRLDVMYNAKSISQQAFEQTLSLTRKCLVKLYTDGRVQTELAL